VKENPAEFLDESRVARATPGCDLQEVLFVDGSPNAQPLDQLRSDLDRAVAFEHPGPFEGDEGEGGLPRTGSIRADVDHSWVGCSGENLILTERRQVHQHPRDEAAEERLPSGSSVGVMAEKAPGAQKETQPGALGGEVSGPPEESLIGRVLRRQGYLPFAAVSDVPQLLGCRRTGGGPDAARPGPGRIADNRREALADEGCRPVVLGCEVEGVGLEEVVEASPGPQAGVPWEHQRLELDSVAEVRIGVELERREVEAHRRDVNRAAAQIDAEDLPVERVADQLARQPVPRCQPPADQPAQRFDEKDARAAGKIQHLRVGRQLVLEELVVEDLAERELDQVRRRIVGAAAPR
jgi:hypothetical protein